MQDEPIVLAVQECLIEAATEAAKETHHFKVKTDHPTDRIKNGSIKIHSRKGLESAREFARKHYESQGHTNVSLVHQKTTAFKGPSKSTPEQRMKGRERHFLRTGVSKGTTDWLRARGML